MTNAIPPSGSALRGAVDLSALVQRQQQASQPEHGAHSTSVPGDQIVFETDDAAFGHTLELSRTVPVIVALWATWSEPSKALLGSLERLVRARGGSLVLAAADADRSPQLVQALQAQSIPTVVAAGRRPARAALRGRAARRRDRPGVRPAARARRPARRDRPHRSRARPVSRAPKPRAPSRPSRPCRRCTKRPTTPSSEATTTLRHRPIAPRSPRTRATHSRAPGSPR